MVIVKIETIGAERFSRGIIRWGIDCKDLRPAFNQIATDFYKMNNANFNAQGKPKKFAKLSKKYKAWKALHYPGRPILVLTGRLKRSLTGYGQSESQDTIRDIKYLSAELGTKVPYAEKQYYAGRKGVQLTDQRREKWAKIIQQYVIGKYKERMSGGIGLDV
jgi:phage gpG-like protein